MKTISALTLDTKKDGWEDSRGFVKRRIPMPILNEKKDSTDATKVLIRVAYAGICGTDRGIWNRQVFRDLLHSSLKAESKNIRVLGHEFVGEIVQAGSQVGNLYGLKMGDNVSGDSHVTCGTCFQCHIGQQEVCQDQAIMGISTDGAFAEFIKIPAKNLWPVDFTRIRPQIASILDPFGNAVHACSKVDLRGKRVAVLGCGPIGLFVIALCKSFGAAKVVACDLNKENLVSAKNMGAGHVIDISGSSQSLSKEIGKLTYDKGVDVTFEMAGPNDSLNNALAITRSGGDVILFGLKDGDFVVPNFNRIIVKGLTLHGVIGRQIFNTWQTSQRVLSDKNNGIQDKIWKFVLKQGKGTILPFSEYTPDNIEKMMARWPKILMKMKN
jgi:threonine 3-dehydrogenase